MGFFQTFLASLDTYHQPTQAEEDHKRLGQTYFVYHTEVGAIEGSINPQKKREEGVAHMVQFYIQSLSLYLASSLRVSFLPLFQSQYSVASPRARCDPAVLDGIGAASAARPGGLPRHRMLQVSVQSLHSFDQSV